MHSVVNKIITDISRVILDKEHEIKLSLTCIFSKGHLLIEDLPGMGKTTLSHTLSLVLGLNYKRVQFTSDLLPSDILGTNIFNAKDHTFTFHKGPVFTQVLLADEINRAGPKTQSALLEAMEEKQVTVDGHKYSLPTPFFVIATQNPLNQSGTFALPESQLDRFFMRISLGYPSKEAEKKLIMGTGKTDVSDISCQINADDLSLIQQEIEQVILSVPVINYILDLVNATRKETIFATPLSPRASIALTKAAKAWAYIEGRNYVTPNDVQIVFPYVSEHRLGLHNKADKIQLTNLISTVAVPV
ncbi:MoxR family ATPase [Pseudoalteromonas sp. MMG010]|uniref:AAA family ATPase n=1 Tax=Pseudoalteromonas sp. MMG010 TaxID=2822685 RepID=UPI001B39EAC2|nr:MoxR family ATPase [Pseudoalteromonas sp. MMG010]MBQ4832417.1 MoxR family ATPase [Pseudoalteromonas sp. MMG010]